MYKEGHVGAGLLLYAPMGFVGAVAGTPSVAVLGAVAAGVLAMLPDVDTRLPLLANRGWTHTVWFALIVGIVLAVIGGIHGTATGGFATVGWAAFGLLVGILTIGSHIAADALTPAGVEPLAPVRAGCYSHDVAKASNPIANFVLMALGVLIAGLAVGVGGTLS